MQGVLSQSAGRRFIKKLGVALVWAALVGSGAAPLVYFRPARPAVTDEDAVALPLHLEVLRQLEALELWTYDWRIREVALASSRPEEVVVLAIDDETLANARQSGQPELAVQPWPRALLGDL
ncbi:MAG: CHASE2 domain-containing protein, partial [Myxococcaceae bacterium]